MDLYSLFTRACSPTTTRAHGEKKKVSKQLIFNLVFIVGKMKELLRQRSRGWFGCRLDRLKTPQGPFLGASCSVVKQTFTTTKTQRGLTQMRRFEVNA